jgi:hypothetical protein
VEATSLSLLNLPKHVGSKNTKIAKQLTLSKPGVFIVQNSL